MTCHISFLICYSFPPGKGGDLIISRDKLMLQSTNLGCSQDVAPSVGGGGCSVTVWRYNVFS